MYDTGKDGKMPGFYIYRETALLLENLSVETAGTIIQAAARYFRTGERPQDLPPDTQAIFWMFAQKMDEGAEKYAQKCERLAQNRQKRWEQRQRETEQISADDSKNQTDINKHQQTSDRNQTEVFGNSNTNYNYNPNSNSNSNSNPNSCSFNNISAADEDRNQTDINHNSACCDAGLTQIIQTYEDNIGVFPPAAKEPLLKWRDEFSDEIIMLAIKRSALAGVKKWNYINGILKSWKTNGVKTLADVQDQDRQNTPKPKNGKATRTANEDYDEIFAEMFNSGGGST